MTPPPQKKRVNRLINLDSCRQVHSSNDFPKPRVSTEVDFGGAGALRVPSINKSLMTDGPVREKKPLLVY